MLANRIGLSCLSLWQDNGTIDWRRVTGLVCLRWGQQSGLPLDEQLRAQSTFTVRGKWTISRFMVVGSVVFCKEEIGPSVDRVVAGSGDCGSRSTLSIAG